MEHVVPLGLGILFGVVSGKVSWFRHSCGRREAGIHRVLVGWKGTREGRGVSEKEWWGIGAGVESDGGEEPGEWKRTIRKVL